MRVALVVALASLLLLIGWISMRMARNPEPGRRPGRRRAFLPHDGKDASQRQHGDGDGSGGQ